MLCIQDEAVNVLMVTNDLSIRSDDFTLLPVYSLRLGFSANHSPPSDALISHIGQDKV